MFSKLENFIYRYNDEMVKLDTSSFGGCRLSIAKAHFKDSGDWKCTLTTEDDQGKPDSRTVKISVVIAGSW